jgi:hypothetical protein
MNMMSSKHDYQEMMIKFNSDKDIIAMRIFLMVQGSQQKNNNI